MKLAGAGHTPAQAYTWIWCCSQPYNKQEADEQQGLSGLVAPAYVHS